MASDAGVRPTRLRRPIEYSRHVDLTPAVVQQRLRGAIDRGTTIPVQSPDRSRPKVAGSVDGSRITLLLHDANILTRRRSWNVAFDGGVVPDGSGTLVRGTVDIPDRKPLDQLMLLFKIASVAALLIVGALAVRGWVTDGSWSPNAVVTAVLGAIAGIVIPNWLRVEGETAAASDAALIIRFLDNVAASPDTEDRDRQSTTTGSAR